MRLVKVFKDGEFLFEANRADYPENGTVIPNIAGKEFYKIIGRTIKMDGSIELEVE
jgi:hypothetical protein